jgi:hypothetical protein
MRERTESMTTLEQTSGRTLASGEYPHCKTERDLVQDKTIDVLFMKNRIERVNVSTHLSS